MKGSDTVTSLMMISPEAAIGLVEIILNDANWRFHLTRPAKNGASFWRGEQLLEEYEVFLSAPDQSYRLQTGFVSGYAFLASSKKLPLIQLFNPSWKDRAVPHKYMLVIENVLNQRNLSEYGKKAVIAASQAQQEISRKISSLYPVDDT